MIIKEWFSQLVGQFFNADTYKRNETLINLISEFLDQLQQERFKDDLYSPFNLLHNLTDLTDVDNVDVESIKQEYKQFYPFTEILNNRIDDKMDWRSFVKLLPEIYANSGLSVNLDFFKFVTGEIEYEKMNRLNDENVALLNRIGLLHLIDDKYFFNTSIPMNKNNYTHNVIPNLYNITSLDNLTINKEIFFEFLTSIKPAGVLFLLIQFIVFDNQTIVHKINQSKFAIKDSINQIYTSYRDILFQENDKCENIFSFEELKSTTFIETEGLLNWWDVRFYSHSIDFNYLSDRVGDIYEVETVLDLNDTVVDGNEATYTIDLNNDELDLNE